MQAREKRRPGQAPALRNRLPHAREREANLVIPTQAGIHLCPYTRERGSETTHEPTGFAHGRLSNNLQRHITKIDYFTASSCRDVCATRSAIEAYIKGLVSQSSSSCRASARLPGTTPIADAWPPRRAGSGADGGIPWPHPPEAADRKDRRRGRAGKH